VHFLDNVNAQALTISPDEFETSLLKCKELASKTSERYNKGIDNNNNNNNNNNDKNLNNNNEEDKKDKNNIAKINQNLLLEKEIIDKKSQNINIQDMWSSRNKIK
jgi:hypothetical protein